MHTGFEKDKGPVMDRGQGFGVGEADEDVFQSVVSCLEVPAMGVFEVDVSDMDVLDDGDG